MKKLLRSLVVVLTFALLMGQIATAPAFAQGTTGTISGMATDSGGQPLIGVTITATGPATASATSDQSGLYTIGNLPPGLYRVTATKPGYTSAEQTDYTVLAGQTSRLDVQLAAATLSSLRVIGQVTVNSGARSTFNASPASQVTLNTQTFVEQQQMQVQRILDQTPGIVIDHPGTNANNASPGAITLPSIRGGLAFETASLIDGHPLAVGDFGDFVSTFLNSYTLQDVEVVKGPGAAAPQINFAINGTVNFRTLDPTTKPHGQVILGMDSFGGQYSNWRYTGTTANSKFAWALDYAVNGTPGPLNGNAGYVDIGSGGAAPNASTGETVLINGSAWNSTVGGSTTGTLNNNAGIRNYPTVGKTTLLACCLNAYETFNNKNELAKLRYNFSPVTEFTFTYLGEQTWTDQNGNHLYQFLQNFAPGASYAGAGGPAIFAPGNYPIWYFSYNPFPVTEWEVDNEPMFEGEFRTTIHDDILLARWYAASINRLQYNNIQTIGGTSTFPLKLYGTVTTAAGPQTFTGQTANITLGPSATGYCQNPQGYWLSAATCTANGQALTDYFTDAYFRSMEEDKLHGASFEYDHFLGNTGNTVTLAYDNVKMQNHTYSYEPEEFSDSVPAGTFEQFGTLLLRGIFNFNKLNVTLSNYIDSYWQHYPTNKNITTAQVTAGNPAYLGIAGLVNGSMNPFMTFTDTRYNRYDGRVGLEYRASPNISLRGSAGSSVAPPYLSLMTAATTTPAQTGICSNLTCYSQTLNAGGTIVPETAMGYDIGGDFRISRDQFTVLSTDIYRTTLWNQFITSGATVPVGGWNGTTSCTIGSAGCLPLYATINENLSHSRYDGFELSIIRDPSLGWGFIAQAAVSHDYPYNLSPCTYGLTVNSSGSLVCATTPTTNLAIVPGVNFQNSGNSGTSSYNSISNHALPYAQAYLEGHYRWRNFGYAELGLQLYGNNNSLNVPAFWLANAGIVWPFGLKTRVALNIDNLFNTEANAWSTAWGGNCVVLVNGQCGLTNGYSIGPRNLRLSVTRDIGG